MGVDGKMTETGAMPGGDDNNNVTSQKKRGRGRPPEPGALSMAERQERCRAKRAAKLERIALGLMRAKKAGDWSAVEALALELLRI